MKRLRALSTRPKQQFTIVINNPTPETTADFVARWRSIQENGGPWGTL